LKSEETDSMKGIRDQARADGVSRLVLKAAGDAADARVWRDEDMKRAVDDAQRAIETATFRAKVTADAAEGTLSKDEANAILAGASPLLVPVFEALLLQQNMHNALRSQRS
jgi:hypothetical protein